MAEKKAPKVGDKVSYVPNDADYSSRPKGVKVPATVINDDLEQEFKHPKTEKQTKRKVYNLVVLQDVDPCVTRKVRVPHKADALEGESYFE